MSVPTDGGPAFPIPMAFNASSQPVTAGMYFPDVNGMSLRDWFAGQVLCALVSRNNDDCFSGKGIQLSRAEIAFDYADAMLKAREAPTT